MDASCEAKPARQGFTLVELLVVVVIIAILAGFITNAAFRARIKAKEAVIGTEISQLEMALQEYKNKVGEYPPDFFGLDSADAAVRTAAKAAVVRHLRKAFPRYNLGSGTIDQQFAVFANDLATNYGLNAFRFTPATALPFWLGGLPESVPDLSDGNDHKVSPWQPVGFHADPQHPFRVGLPRTQRYHEFTNDRFDVVTLHAGGVGVGDQLRYYCDSVVGGEKAPYVYFKARRLANGRYEYGLTCDYNSDGKPDFFPAYYDYMLTRRDAGSNVCVPYLDAYPGTEPYWGGGSSGQPPSPGDADPGDPDSGLISGTYIRKWRNLETFQIVAPGLDGRYGTVREDPTVPVFSAKPSEINELRFRFTKTGTNFSHDDRDNLTNFAEGRLETEFE